MSGSRRWAAGVAVAVEIMWWLSLAAALAVAVVLALVAVHRARGSALTLDFYFHLPRSAYQISAGQLSQSAARVGVMYWSLAG